MNSSRSGLITVHDERWNIYRPEVIREVGLRKRLIVVPWFVTIVPTVISSLALFHDVVWSRRQMVLAAMFCIVTRSCDT